MKDNNACKPVDRRALEAWLQNLPTLTDEDREEGYRLILKRARELVGRDARAPHPKSNWELYARDDVKGTADRILALAKAGHASPRLLISWRRHLVAEQSQDGDERRIVRRHVHSMVAADRMALPLRRQSLDDLKDHERASLQEVAFEPRGQQHPVRSRAAYWAPDFPSRWRKLFDGVDIEIQPTLGRDIAGTVFVSPSRIHVVLGEDSFFDDLEAEFILNRLVLHALIDLPSAGFGCWIEPKTEIDSHRLKCLVGNVARYREDEALTNDLAVCWMYDRYCSECSAERYQGIVRNLLRRRVATIPVIWTIFHERDFLREQLTRTLSAASTALAGRTLLSTLRPKPRFPRELAVVRSNESSPPYLVWTDSAGNRWRRRIPSRHVVYTLGLCLDFLANITPEQLDQYSACGILIDPDEVSAVRAMLDASSGRGYLPLPGRGGRWDSEMSVNISPAEISHQPSRHYLVLASERSTLVKSGEGTNCRVPSY